MGYLKYYEDEQARWPRLANKEIHWKLVRELVHRLAKEFHLQLIDVHWTRGNRKSSAYETHIVLNSDNLTWLDVIHQLAHTWMEQRYQKKEGRRTHGKHHRKIVDRLAALVVEKQWETGVLESEVKQRTQTKQQEEQEKAETQQKIEQEQESLRLQRHKAKVEERRKNRPLMRMQTRREEVEKLERQIRRLTKRLKKKKNSLKAYERRMNKIEAPQIEATKEDDFSKPIQMG